MAKGLVGALRVTLGLDSAQFASGAARAQGIGQKLGRSLRGIGLASIGMAAGIAAGLKVTLDFADRMGETAQKLGMPVEALTALKYAAEQSGVPFETLEGSLLRLSKNLADSPQKFADLGVSIRDTGGVLRPTADILADIADKMQAMPDGAEKTALAMDLFGKAGADMVLALNGGSEGLKALMQEARDLGIVISDETADAAGKFNDNLGKLQAAAGGLGVQLAAELAPILERISGYAVDAAKAFGQLSPETKEMVAQVAAAIGVVGAAAIGFGLLALAVSPLSVTIGLIAAGAALIYDNWGPITEWFRDFWADIKVVVGYAWDKIKESIGSAIDWMMGRWQAFTELLSGAVETAKAAGTAIADALTLGNNTVVGGAVTDGLVDGILSGRGFAADAGRSLGAAAANGLKDYLGINSPSRVAAGYGLNVAEGLAQGVTQGTGIVDKAVKGLSDTAAGAMKGIGDLGARIGDMFAGAATNVLTGVESLSEAVGKLLQQLASMLINSAMKSFFGSIFGGLDLGGALPGYATGTNSAAAGWAMVGEEGPELMRMRGGERVYNNRETRGMLGAGGEGGGPVHMTSNVYLDGELIRSQMETVEGEAAIGRVMRRLGR